MRDDVPARAEDTAAPRPNLPIYLDYHATTPVDPRVLDAMLPYFTARFGNAASRSHPFGWDAAKAVDRGRQQVADLIGASASEIVFTSGATESINLAIKGVALPKRARCAHVITLETEHKATLDSCKHLEHEGCSVTVLPVQRDGLLDLQQLRDAITPATVLISVMTVNNEIGVIQPVAEIAAHAHERGVLFHTDAAQALGRIPFDVSAIGADLVSFTAHKMYGPKGVGALYVSRRAAESVQAQIDGGGHERGLRSGTLNVPGIVGFGAAAQLAGEELSTEPHRIGALRDAMLRALLDGLSGVSVNGSLEHRVRHNLNVSFDGIEGESLLTGIGDLAVSAGAACTSASVAPSHVLKSIGVPDNLASASIRFGLGRYTTAEDIEYASQKVIAVVRRLREMSPLAHDEEEDPDVETLWRVP